MRRIFKYHIAHKSREPLILVLNILIFYCDLIFYCEINLDNYYGVKEKTINLKYWKKEKGLPIKIYL